MDTTAQSDQPIGMPQQPLENQPPLPQQTKRKLNWKGFIIGIVVVVLIEVFAFHLLNSDNKKTVSIHPTPVPTRAQSNDNKIWNTYTDNKSNFSFNYPKDWYIEKTAKFSSVPSQYSGWLTVLTDPATFTDTSKIVLCSKSQDSMVACLDDIGKDNKLTEPISTITVNGYTAKSFRLIGQGDLDLRVVQIDGPSGQKVELSTSEFVEGTDKIFSKILSSFKFTNQQPPMVGQFYWNVPANSISADMEKELKIAFAAYDSSENHKDPSSNYPSVDEIVVSSESADFAFAELTVRNHENKIIPTDGIEYYLQKANGKWEIITGGDSNFCQKVKVFPKDLINDTSYYNYYGCPQ